MRRCEGCRDTRDGLAGKMDEGAGGQEAPPAGGPSQQGRRLCRETCCLHGVCVRVCVREHVNNQAHGSLCTCAREVAGLWALS